MKHHGIVRLVKHLVSHRWQVKRYFSDLALKHIEAAIEDSEKQHSGEICFVVESGLHPYEIVHGKTPRARAIEVFSRFHVWDTEHNNGVLIYVLLADRNVEIVADRGIHSHVKQMEWEKICNEMEAMFKQGEFEAGVLQGIASIGALMQQHFSLTQAKTIKASNQQAGKKKRNELSNKPLVL